MPLMKNDFHTLFPLEALYAGIRQNSPPFVEIPETEIPQPQRQLLAHSNDMTPTLESFYRQNIALNVLHKTVTDEYLHRMVTLDCENDEPVLFGAICIHLLQFPEPIRSKTLACRQPLGSILRDHPLPHSSEPLFFFRVLSDAVINRAFGMTQSRWLFGRLNRLLLPDGQPLVEVVEILPETSPK